LKTVEKFTYRRLKQYREWLKMSQLAASMESGVGQSDISRLEAGKMRFIPPEYLQFLHRKGCDLNYLFDGVAKDRLLDQEFFAQKNFAQEAIADYKLIDREAAANDRFTGCVLRLRRPDGQFVEVEILAKAL
jgi:transcriptional regulator with XRE-family HTH domain